MQHFASDNYAGICPEALAALIEANNSGHEPAYGDDSWTQRVCDRIRDLFQTDCEVFFVFNGTAANSLALASLCQSYHSVICHELAHIETDECGGPEFFSGGSKLLTAPGIDGKLTPDAIEAIVTRRADIHYPKPKVVTLTQSTEVGTVYSVEEMRAIAAIAKRRHLKVHMDGARFANAVAALDVHPSEITWRAGVDVLCFGGTKNGLPVGEAVMFFDKALAVDFRLSAETGGATGVEDAFHLGALARFARQRCLAAQRAPCERHGATDGRAAGRHTGVKVMFKPQANAVFAELPPAVAQALRNKGWKFYQFIGSGGCRLMCAWDTLPETVEQFAAEVRALCTAL